MTLEVSGVTDQQSWKVDFYMFDFIFTEAEDVCSAEEAAPARGNFFAS